MHLDFLFALNSHFPGIILMLEGQISGHGEDAPESCSASSNECPLGADPLHQQKEDPGHSSSPCLAHYDCSTTCSSPSSSSSTSSKSECKNCCRKCREEEERRQQQQQQNDVAIISVKPQRSLAGEWPNGRPDAKWKVRTIGLLAALLPGIGCYFCLAYTYALQLDKVTNFTIPSTFCPGLKSMFPPVSYSIGVWKPQKYIWLMVLALHLPPRFFYAVVYKNHYSLGQSEYRSRSWFNKMIRLHYVLLVIEAIGLTAVSVIDIESHFRVHASCFALWLIPFSFNMLFNNILHYHSGIRKLKPMHDRVFQLKCVLFLIGYPLSVSTGLSYLTFVITCNTIPYATFSLAEYVLVGINSIFYFLLVWEFDGSKVEVYIKHKHHQQAAVITKKNICA